jgi:ribulose-5-phosphate 4-epimerase/fuculose-1-phosphate aldolase
MTDRIALCINELVQASRILAVEEIVDAFGHISARHPEHADRFLISRVRAPEQVEHADIVELTLDGEPVRPTDPRSFAELPLHAAVYRTRPDVMSVCHHHAPSILPFCVAGLPLVPVVHLGATMGSEVPFWDARGEFGEGNLLVANMDQALSMARALGSQWTVLLRNHGATVAGRSIRECVFRAIYGAHNASVQQRAMALGQVHPLSRAEALAAGEFNLSPIALDRSWDRWSRRAARELGSATPLTFSLNH